MSLSNGAIERGLALFWSLVEEEPELRREFEASRAAFFDGQAPAGQGPGQAERLAHRRHLEWYLLERHSEHLGGVPVEALMETWVARSDGVEQAHVEALLNTRAGVFEVTDVEDERGFWIHDLFGLGEYALHRPAAAVELVTGDVIVGRVFPVGDSLYLLSPAAAAFRNAELKTALKEDVLALRSSRRGSMRIAQSELERMFHGPGARFGKVRQVVDPGARLARTREVLVGAGVPATLAERVLAELAGASDAGAVTEALNQLAFETDADLERARAELLELWSALHAGDSAAARPARSGFASDDPVSSTTVANALARFDSARHAGGDLEALFKTLEDDLGIEASGATEDEGELPDFPGVVGAMVEEFLWDTRREAGGEQAARYEGLRRLGRFASSVGIFESLSGRDLLDFTARWLLDEGELGDADQARAVLEALEAFCRWCEIRQDLPLWKDFGDRLAGLQASIPRLVEARKRIDGPRAGDTLLYEFARDEHGGTVLIDPQHLRTSIELEEGLGARLRPGDLLLARIVAAADVRVSACYPAELAALKPRSLRHG